MAYKLTADETVGFYAGIISGQEKKIAALQAEIARLHDLIAERNMEGEYMPSVDCMMCSKGTPPRKATTSIADIPACDQCAQEYQDAEDALGAGE